MAANAAQQLHFCFTGDYVFLAFLPAHAIAAAGSSGGSGAGLGLIATLYLTRDVKELIGLKDPISPVLSVKRVLSSSSRPL